MKSKEKMIKEEGKVKDQEKDVVNEEEEKERIVLEEE